MKITDLKEGPFEGEIECTIVSLEEVKKIPKFGRTLKLVNGVIEDDSGSMKIAFWNEDVGRFKEGDKIRISNGFVRNFRDELIISAGRNGNIEKL